MNKLLETFTQEKPLPIIGVLNAFLALMAEDAGFKALYLSGASLSSGQLGKPDIGLITLDHLIEETTRIRAVSPLPLLVDIDTGFDDIKELAIAGADGVQIEDQIEEKKCGHLSGKHLVETEEMVSRIRQAKKADVAVVARSDALAIEGLDKTIERAKTYIEAGADILFVEAIQTLEQIEQIKQAIKIPLLVNVTEFGKTPLWSVEEMAKYHVDALLFPMTVTRAMYKTAQNVLQGLRREGTQKHLVDQMMTRKELYRLLRYEEKL